VSSRRKIRLPVDSAEVPRYVGIATFMHLPLMEELDAVDIGVFGIPFDLGLAYRPGARFGPSAVREASRLIRRVNPATGVFPFALCQVADVGDVNCHPYDFDGAIAEIEAFVVRLRANGALPLACGGDHVVPAAVLRGLRDLAPLGMVHFDSHPDTLDVFYGKKVTHATAMRLAVEEGILDPARCIQVGLRGSQWDGKDYENSVQLGMNVVSYDRYESIGREAMIAEIRDTVGDGPAYVSFDIDALDPSEAPGTAVPEPGGFSMRDVQVILRSLRGLNIVGADISEVSPPYDPTGITAVNAANLMFEILCLMVEADVTRRR